MFTAKLILERIDREGNLAERREQQSRSFLKGFIELLYVAHAQIADATPYPMEEIGGVAKDVDNQSADSYKTKCNLKMGACPGHSQDICHPGCANSSGVQSILMDMCGVEGELIGIQVGTGVGAVTPTDIAMGTRIVHGNTAGTFEYGGCEFSSLSFVNPNGEFTIRRYFTNNSGGAITVNEVGIHAAGSSMGERFAWQFLIARDIVGGGIAVADAELLKVTYVPQITV